MQFGVIFIKCILQFLEDISPGSDSHGVPAVGVSTGPVTESVVMLGSKHNVPESRASQVRTAVSAILRERKSHTFLI